MEQVIDKLKRYTKQDIINLTDRGNTAIFIAFDIVKKLSKEPLLLIPDQGGWSTYKTYPKMLGLNLEEIQTNDGIIDLEVLKEKAQDAKALIISSFAGYFAEQPLKEISQICHDNKCLLIEDASGSITDNTLCNGNYSDIIVASFGKWKAVNVGYGGFISMNDKEHYNKAKEALSLTRISPSLIQDLNKKLSPERLNFLLDQAKTVKKKLKDYQIFHQNKRGLNVVTENNPMILEFCEENHYDFIKCPTYKRINQNAISIELKRIE